jgi:hypothetical protein
MSFPEEEGGEIRRDAEKEREMRKKEKDIERREIKNIKRKNVRKR